MLDAAAFVDRALGRARTALVPAHLAATVFEAAASRLRPELVARIETIFAARPWPGWLTKAEREQLRGRRVRRRAPWPRDPREVPFRLNEQHRLLDLHYATETVARGKDTRTLRLFRKNPHVELADVRLHAWEAPRARIRRSVADVTRAELQRNVDAAHTAGKLPELPLEGVVVEVLRGGAWLVALFGDVQVRVQASDVELVEETSETADARLPWWRVAPAIPRHEDTHALRTEAAAILEAVRAYLTDPEWLILDDQERVEIIHAAVVPLWEPDDADRLTQAVADVDGGLRDEDEVIEEIAAALRDGTDPELELHTIPPDAACNFVRVHHRHLPECNRRGIVHALAARWRGQIVAVALAGAPTGRWGRTSSCPPEGTLEITRVASIAGLRRYDRRGRLVPVGAASALVARLVDLLPKSGRGVAGCRLITYQLTSEDGAIYRALVAKGLRPVTRSDHRQAGGARSRVALAGAKIRWEAGPAAGPPDWNLLQPQHRPGARAAFDAFERRQSFLTEKIKNCAKTSVDSCSRVQIVK